MSNGPRSPMLAIASAIRRLGLPALATGLIGLAAALPTSATAEVQPRVEAATPALAVQANVTALTPQAVQQLLAQIPLGGSGVPPVDLEVPQLAKVLVELPGLDALPSVSGLGGSAGVEAALREAIAKLAAGGLSLGELLSPQALSGELVKELEENLHVPITPLIESALHKSPQTLLGEGLGSLSLNELLGKLLGGASNPMQLIDELLEHLNPSTLQTLLGTLPSSSPVQNLDLAELASALSKTPAALAEGLGKTLATLPETAQAATKALSGGSELALLKGSEGVSFGLVERATQNSDSNGSTGAAGNSGGTPAASTVVVRMPAATAPAAASTAAAAGKVKIISHKVKGKKATLVVQVPSAGRLTVSGSGFKKVTTEASKAERVTVHTTLTRARAASLRRHHSRKAKVKLTSTFVPVSGHSSAASATVTVR